MNHAGENGAIHIYAGQLLIAPFTAPSLVAELREFKSHEEKHRSIFGAELERRHLPRCRSYWLCAAGGLVLGVLTALLGRHAIAATTVAVERVVLGHLKQQVRVLMGKDQAAVEVISTIVAEEQHHHDRSTSHLSADAFWLRVLSPVVAAATESVVWLGMHL